MAQIPEARLIEFLVEVLKRRPARHSKRSKEGKPGRLKRSAGGELVYPPFRLHEHDHAHLCYLVNQVTDSWGLGYMEFNIKEYE